MSKVINMFNAFVDEVSPEDFVWYEKQRVLLLSLIGGLVSVEEFDEKFDALIMEKRSKSTAIDRCAWCIDADDPCCKDW